MGKNTQVARKKWTPAETALMSKLLEEDPDITPSEVMDRDVFPDRTIQQIKGKLQNLRGSGCTAKAGSIY